jgi:hypothetical protein
MEYQTAIQAFEAKRDKGLFDLFGSCCRRLKTIAAASIPETNKVITAGSGTTAMPRMSANWRWPIRIAAPFKISIA